MPNTIILIPSRMAASRLPGKPLLKINNLPIISHVFNKAKKTNIGRVVVCTEDEEILNEVKKNGGEAILTSKNHKSGSDRILEGFNNLNVKDTDYILNLQGDEPNIESNDIVNLNKLMINHNSDIGTMATIINDKSMLSNKNIVKVFLREKLNKNNFPFALDFSRDDLSHKYKNIYHHVGIYIFKIKVLQKFVNLKQTKNEIVSRLEQLRALENNIKINVGLAKFSPIGVDAMEDYLALKKNMEYKLKK